MTSNNYLEKILEQQALTDDSPEMKQLQQCREQVETVLGDKFPGTKPVIRYGGSKAKGTMNLESYDLDLIWYLRNNDTTAGDTLEEIFNNVATALEGNYEVERKTSALRLKSKNHDSKGQDFHIDVVPGRFTDDTQGDTYLYVSDNTKDRLKTNLQKHIDHVRNSKVVGTIRLAKLWNVYSGLRVKTFILELLVVKALDTAKENEIGLSTALTKFWQYLVDHKNSLAIDDPANPAGNDLSPILNSFKDKLCNAAERSLASVKTDGWESVFETVQSTSHTQRIEAINKTVATIHTPVKPWAGSD